MSVVAAECNPKARIYAPRHVRIGAMLDRHMSPFAPLHPRQMAADRGLCERHAQPRPKPSDRGAGSKTWCVSAKRARLQVEPQWSAAAGYIGSCAISAQAVVGRCRIS